MASSVKTWLMLLLIHALSCPTMSNPNQPFKESTWSYKRFATGGNKGNIFKRLFYPTKCNPHQRYPVACIFKDGNNETICVEKGCCFADETEISCFKVSIDKPKQILNVIGIGGGLLLFVALCPFICCLIVQSSKLNPLRRKRTIHCEVKDKDKNDKPYSKSKRKKNKKKSRGRNSSSSDMP